MTCGCKDGFGKYRAGTVVRAKGSGSEPKRGCTDDPFWYVLWWESRTNSFLRDETGWAFANHRVQWWPVARVYPRGTGVGERVVGARSCAERWALRVARSKRMSCAASGTHMFAAGRSPDRSNNGGRGGDGKIPEGVDVTGDTGLHDIQHVFLVQ